MRQTEFSSYFIKCLFNFFILSHGFVWFAEWLVVENIAMETTFVNIMLLRQMIKQVNKTWNVIQYLFLSKLNESEFQITTFKTFRSCEN